mgnify:CR=1 FL=1
MKSHKKYFSISATIFCSALFLIGLTVRAQELNAEVQVLSPNIQSTNKQVFTTLETAIINFLNTRKWTGETYQPEERIKCSFIINITEWNNEQFKGTLQIQYSRPIFKSGYNSPVLVHMDNDFQFEYLEFDRLDFSENTSLSNLTSVLAYYVYVIIGMDHDTYAKKGGDPFYDQALAIVNNSQNNGFPGWSGFSGGNKNRFWLIDNLQNPAFDGIRLCWYQYHRQGMDLMFDPAQQNLAKKNIKTSLMQLDEVNNKRPNSFLMQLFFDAKSQEIINIFSGGDPMNLADLKEVLIEIDGNNANKYEAMGRS